jgi:hypothetical protein
MPQGMLPGPLRMQPGTPARQAQMQPEMLPKLLQMQPGTPKFTQFARESSKVRPKDAREAGKVEAKDAREDLADARDAPDMRLR